MCMHIKSGIKNYKCADKCSFVPNCPKLIFSFVPKRAPKLGFLSFVPFQKPKISVASGTALDRLWPFQMTLILLYKYLLKRFHKS